MSEKLKYNLIENETAYEISNINQDISGEIIIPPLHEGKPVKRIAKASFMQCKNLTNIKIPDSVESIGEFAFRLSGISDNWNKKGIIYADKWVISVTDGKSKVKEDMVFKDGTIGIADYSISGKYSSITIPSTLKHIGKEVFFHCHKIGVLNDFEKIIVEEGNKIYRTDGNNLVRVSDNTLIFGLDGIIPNYIKKIGEGAFKLNLDLKSVIIPDSVTHIENEAFCACKNLKEILIPKGVTHIGREAFFNCRNLLKIIIPDTVETIGPKAFNRTGEKKGKFNIFVRGYTEKQKGWDNDWNLDNHPVIYDYHGKQ